MKYQSICIARPLLRIHKLLLFISGGTWQGTVADKELMRPLYERYREVKKLLSAHRSSGTSSSAAAAGLLRQHQVIDWLL